MLEDVVHGYVTVEGARRDYGCPVMTGFTVQSKPDSLSRLTGLRNYGVVIDPGALGVDLGATRQLREERRKRADSSLPR